MRRTLLDGTQIDDTAILSTVPRVLAVDHPNLAHSAVGDVYDADFGGESLPDWLSYETDDSDTSPTFNGIGSSTVSLDSGDGTVSALQTDPINWDNWSGIHVYAHFDSFSDIASITFGDDKDEGVLENGFKVASIDGDGAFQRVVDGGSDLNNAKQTTEDSDEVDEAPKRFGFSIEEGHEGNGHNVRFYGFGELSDEWIEDDGFPPDTDYNISVGAKDGTADLDRFLLILVP